MKQCKECRVSRPTIQEAVEQRRIVQVYYNIPKHTFSIKDKKSGLVIGHSRRLALRNCKLRVSEAGRQRVIKTKTKNVHAYIEGEIEASTVHDIEGASFGLVELTYNPYKYDSFVIKNNKQPVDEAKRVVFNTRRIWGEGLF